MRQRLISAAVLVPVVVIVFLLGDPWLTLGIALLAGLGAFEAVTLVRSAGVGASRWLAVGAAPLLVLAASMMLAVSECFGACENYAPSRSFAAGWTLALFALVVLGAALVALRERQPREGLSVWLGTTFAALYPALLVFLVGILYLNPDVRSGVLDDVLDAGRVWLLVLVLSVWSLDTFAYVAGKYHGRGRFMNHISPNKTWSGVVGGTAACLLVCTLLVWATGHQPLAGMALGALIAVAAQAGDLAESMLKRAAGAKDSGALIPGHGGILDRVDSFLFAGPAMFVALLLAQLYGPR